MEMKEETISGDGGENPHLREEKALDPLDESIYKEKINKVVLKTP